LSVPLTISSPNDPSVFTLPLEKNYTRANRLREER
jgi:hypothetical protein